MRLYQVLLPQVRVDLVWFGLVLWHINHCGLFNAKSYFYMYIKYMICKQILYIHTIKWSNSSISNNSIYHKSFVFTVEMTNSSISNRDRTLLGATTLGQSGLGSDDNEEVLHILQSSSITGASPSDYLMSYPGHLLGQGLPFCEDAVSVFYRPTWLGYLQRE